MNTDLLELMAEILQKQDQHNALIQKQNEILHRHNVLLDALLQVSLRQHHKYMQKEIKGFRRDYRSFKRLFKSMMLENKF